MAGAKAAAGGSAAPLLPAQAGEGSSGSAGGGGATSAQTLGNVVVSIVGTGVLGLPYAFRAAGWVAGSLGVAAAGFAALYCMLLLVSTLYCRPSLSLPPDPHTACCSRVGEHSAHQSLALCLPHRSVSLPTLCYSLQCCCAGPFQIRSSECLVKIKIFQICKGRDSSRTLTLRAPQKEYLSS